MTNKKIEIITVNQNNIKWEIDTTPNELPRKKILSDHDHFARFISSKFPECKKVLDVGTGFGELSILLKKYGYDVTAMDIFSPMTVKILEAFNIKTIKNYLDLKTNISEFDLIVGFHCCDASELIIRNALKSNKKFAVVLCEINQGLENKDIKTRRQYIDYLKGLDKRIRMTRLPIYDSIDSDYSGDTLYLKKK